MYHGWSRPSRCRISSSSCGIRVLAGEAQRRIAGGQQVEDDERDRDHGRDDDRRPEESSGDVEESSCSWPLAESGAPACAPRTAFRSATTSPPPASRRCVSENWSYVPVRDVRAGIVATFATEVRHPRDDLRHQVLVEVLVARQACARRASACALVDVGVDARDVGAVSPSRRLLLASCTARRDPDERVVRVAGRDDRRGRRRAALKNVNGSA